MNPNSFPMVKPQIDEIGSEQGHINFKLLEEG